MDLSVKIKNTVFKNPVILASGTAGFGRELSQFYDLGVLGGISSKGLTLEPRQGNPPIRVAETASGMLNAVGLQNPGVDCFIERELVNMKSYNTVVIANIAGSTESDYIKLAQKLDATDVDMIEMNISCPNVKAGGLAFGIYPNDVEKITKAVRRATGKPLIVKLSPNVADIGENAKAAEAGGADAISLINTLTGMAVDIKSRRPLLHNNIGGLSGPAIKPVALKMTWQAYKAVKIPIIGMGGIATAEDVLEFMLCGASAVQIGTVNISNPFAGKNIVECLTNAAKEVKLSKLSDIVGALIAY